MSMSSLGRQLAALQQQQQGGGSRNAGSTLPTTRRHEDAIGRGVGHSVQLGYSGGAGASSGSASVKYKPSILYEDSRTASDVPLTTIKENAVASFRHLQTDVDPTCGVYISTLCDNNNTAITGGQQQQHHGIMFERGLKTSSENESIDKQIEELLFRLSFYLSSSSSYAVKGDSDHVLSSCLHVIEFLLRQYDLHLRPRIASAALLAFLPHHEEPFFLRLLQLIDLANLPEWTFLRPYAAPNSRLGRHAIAQQAAKNTAFVRMLGQLSQRTAALLVLLHDREDDRPGRNSNSPSSSKCLSFTAAILVEALTLQMKRTGSMDELTCNTLLPFVIAACKSGKKKRKSGMIHTNDEWMNWGHVLASSIIETASLAPKPCKVLITNIIQGLPMPINSQEMVDGRMMSTWYNGFIVVLSILLAQDENRSVVINQDDKDVSYLPILTSTNGSPASSVQCYCGFSGLDNDILKSMIQFDKDAVGSNHADVDDFIDHGSHLASCIGQLVGKEGIVEFIGMIASILVVSWRQYFNNSLKGDGDEMEVNEENEAPKAKKARRKQGIYQALLRNVMLGLISDPMLQESMWKANDSQWVSSLTSFIVLNTQLDRITDHHATMAGTESSADQTFLKRTLETLKQIDIKAFEFGLAHGLIQIHKSQECKRWAHWLGLTSSENGEEEYKIRADGVLPSHSLPPRVAIEHADNTVRLDAISRLLKEASEEMIRIDDIGETIPQAILRRFATDDHEEVTIAAAKGLLQLLIEQNVHDRIIGVELGRGVLDGIFLWAENSTTQLEKRAEIIECGLRLVAFAASKMDRDQDMLNFTFLLEGIGSFMLSSEDEIVNAAAQGVVLALSSDEGRLQNVSHSKLFDKACSMLVTENDIVQAYQRSFGTKNRQEQYFRRKMVKVLLDSFKVALTVNPKKTKQNVGEMAMDYCKWLTNIYGPKLTIAEMDALQSCLMLTLDYVTTCLESFHENLQQLASCEERLFKSAIHPFIIKVCISMTDSSGEKVSPITVIMELALSCDDYTKTKNFLSVAKELIANKNHADNIADAIAPSLALVNHSSIDVRTLAVDILEIVAQFTEADVGPLYQFCLQCVSEKAAALAGSNSSLTDTLAAAIVTAKNPALLQDALLKATFKLIAADGLVDSTNSENLFESAWLKPGFAHGGYNAGSIILDALKNGGEPVCPILSIWKIVGKHTLAAMNSPAFGGLASVSDDLCRLIQSVVQILKALKSPGVTTNQSIVAKTVITTGPTLQGGRQRSYSFGRAEGVSFLMPYPMEMQQSLVSLLSGNCKTCVQKKLRQAVFDVLFKSQSWKSEVFSALSGKTKHEIASALLSDASDGTTQEADLLFFSLPLNASDIGKMIDNLSYTTSDLAKLSYLTDFVRMNVKKLIADTSVHMVVDSIFKRLNILSQASMQSESKEYARNSILDSLYEVFNVALENQSNNGVLQGRKGCLKNWSKMLLDTIHADENSHLDPLTSIQGKRKAYSVIASISRLSPAEAASSLLVAIKLGVTGFQPGSNESISFSECIDIIVPVFLETVDASGLSAKDLIFAFLQSSHGAQQQNRHILYNHFMQSLGRQNSASMNSSIEASFIGAMIACEIHKTTKENHSNDSGSNWVVSEVAANLLGYSNGPSKLLTIQVLQAHVKDLLSAVADDEEDQSDINPVHLSGQDLIYLALHGPQENHKEHPGHSQADLPMIDKLIQTLMVVVCNSITSTEVQRVIKRLKQENVATTFRIWQDLLFVEAIHPMIVDKVRLSSEKDRSLVEGFGEIALQTLDALQSALSTEHFLAFVTTLIRDGETAELRSRSIQLIADRSESLHAGPAEALLFLDMVPLLLELVDKLSSSEESNILIHSTFVAIECIGRKCFLAVDCEDHVPKNAWASAYLNVITKSSKLVDKEFHSWQGLSYDDIPGASLQIIISAALSSSTAIRITGPLALPVLPQFMKALFHFLKSSNESSAANSESCYLTMLYVASLRFFCSVIETLPKFVKPHIGNMILCCSQILRQSQDMKENDRLAVQGDLRRLRRCIIAGVPSRILIPVSSKPIAKSNDIYTSEWIISMVTDSVRSSKSSELSSQIEGVVKVATTSFSGNHASDVEQNKTIDLGINLILALILKLSEVQLRSLYSRLKDWCGPIDKADLAKSAPRRLAFWKLSSRLSLELKSIFLPCLSIAFFEAVTELVRINRLAREGTQTACHSGRLHVEEPHSDVLFSFETVLIRPCRRQQ